MWPIERVAYYDMLADVKCSCFGRTNSTTNMKPVEISKNRRNVAKARFLGNDPSKCVLNKL